MLHRAYNAGLHDAYNRFKIGMGLTSLSALANFGGAGVGAGGMPKPPQVAPRSPTAGGMLGGTGRSGVGGVSGTA